MPHKKRYPVDHFLIKAQKLHHLLRLCRSLLLLKRAILFSIFFKRGTDTDIVDTGRGLQDIESFLIQSFFFADQLRKTAHFHKMLDPGGISAVKADHFFTEIV